MRALLVLALVAVATADVLRFPFYDVVDQHWENFKTTFGKKYESIHEETMRKNIFVTNLKGIEMHNYLYEKGVKHFKVGVNEFSDMDHSEFVQTMNGYKGKSEARGDKMAYLSPLVDFKLPETVDWRDKGYVTPVKNQGQCGSCWAFSSTGSLEGQHFRKTGTMVSLSEQNLVDCSTKYGNNGCEGGLMDNAFQYIKENDGIDTEESYPYQADDEKCKFKSKNVGATDSGFVDIPSGDEDKLKEAVATVGPISVAIDASHMSFQTYQEGIYDEEMCSSTSLDHGVLIVGYGTKDGQDYWLVKNSWGESWGVNGYIYMSRNKDNQCGIATSASYPVV